MRYLLLLFLLFASLTIRAQILYKAGFSAAYNMQKNWNENQASFLTLQSGWMLNYHKENKNRHTFHHLNTEISYVYYPDSIWKTNTDYLKLNLQWNKITGRRLETNTSVYFATRYLNKYHIQNDVRTWQEGFLNPMDLTISYGWKIAVLKKSCIAISASSVRMVVIPASKIKSKNESTILLKNNTTITGQYGFQIQTFVNENYFDERLLWINDSRIYINQISENGVLVDIHNIAAIKIYKWLELRVDTKIQYDFSISNKLRFKQEALIGFYYSNNKKAKEKD